MRRVTTPKIVYQRKKLPWRKKQSPFTEENSKESDLLLP
jgi:hypothetical protein